ncbi:MAG: DNA methyltransferase [Bacillota bacterium]
MAKAWLSHDKPGGVFEVETDLLNEDIANRRLEVLHTTKIEITRTELVWPGKYNEDGTLKEVPRVNFPFQVIEAINQGRATREAKKMPALSGFCEGKEGKTFGEGWRNKLIWGDNLLVIGSLLEEFAGKIDLIYIDPPFATGADFTFTTEIGDGDAEVTKQQSIIEEKAYRDTWGRGIDSYLQMMYSRLRLIRDLLKETGSIYVHLDATVGHYVKPLLDEVFGPASFQREIIWRIGWISGYKSAAKNWIRNHDTILFYVVTPNSFTFNKEYVPYPEGYTRRGGVETTGKGYPIEDVWNANPFEFELTGEDSLDSIQIKSFSREKTGYATQKNESVLRRIINASSNPGDLVADFFCGSGTTLAVAEKLGRRWIGCDLSRFAIHTTRKRLLGIEGCRPFDILNLGKHERRYWQIATFGDRGRTVTERTLHEYLAFILKLYGAQAVAGCTYLHGKKGRAMVHIGAVDAPVTIGEVSAALAECTQLKQTELHVLGWEWEMGLSDLMVAEAKKQGVKLVLVQIPREVMEQQAVDKDDVQFFELAYLEVDIKTPRRLTIQVRLKDFVIPNTKLIPEEVRDKVKKWSDYIDYWAVDWDFQNDTFLQGWVTYRAQNERKLALASAIHTYERPGRYRVLVKVVDIFGNDTSRAFDTEVK